MKHYFKIEKFGKIESAKIETAPLTLFVGDNNSGKSYLLSLLWAIYSADETSVLFSGLPELECSAYTEVCGDISNLLQDSEEEQTIEICSTEFLEVLNAALEKNKDRFVAEIFNSGQVTIQKLSVEIQEEFVLRIKCEKKESRMEIFISQPEGRSGISFPFEMVEKSREFIVSLICRDILLGLLKGKRAYCKESNVVYLPAARTGFMLAKNVINKVGRQMTYDVSGFYGTESEVMEPFTKPIIRFLDALESLSLGHKSEYEEIAAWIEQEMAHGSVQYGSEANGSEICYVPDGSRTSLPLRTSSAVVTELTPLLLLLKYKRRLKAICYEEPEMCLHPQLQQEMGRLLIRLVGSGIFMIATTHSDIMIQHINNMCRLSERNVPGDFMQNLGLVPEDLINAKNVAVYQFTDKGTSSLVEQILPVSGEFRVETFTNALIKMLEQTSEVQEFEGE